MKTFALFLSSLLLSFVLMAQNEKVEYALVIHGGAGTILKKNMTPEKEKAYTEKLTEALKAGEAILKAGGSSVDAVEKVINVLEDSHLFNAGKGAVFTHIETNELDASIMDGKTGKAGAVSGIKTIKNPISAARMVMEKSKHVMLSGDGADEFAKDSGLEVVDPEYFKTERRLKRLRKVKLKEKTELDHDEGRTDASPKSDFSTDPTDDYPDHKYGTVGAVALDKEGNLAAGTSTGGMTNKRWGRIGDSPIIGAGTYASNDACGVSATGHGEFFIRNVVAYDIAALMKYKNLSLKEAADTVIKDKLKNIGGKGGVIALDPKGNVTMSFNTPGMYRGYVKSSGKLEVFFFND